MPPYYQPVINLIASHPPPNGRLDLMLRLCQAVEAEAGGEIVLATDAVVRNVSPRMSPPVLIPEEVIYETMARMLFLGEDADLMRLLEWYERPISFASTRRERTAEHWAGIFEFITPPLPALSENERARQFGRMTTALRCIINAHAEALGTEAPVRFPDPSTGELPPGSFGTVSFGRPSLSSVLADGIRRLVTVWMMLHQQWLDLALDQLAANGTDRGAGLRRLRERWVHGLSRTFLQKRFEDAAPFASIPIQLGTILYGASPHHEYLDAFPVHTDRRFGFTPYEREPQDEPPGKKVWLEDVFRHRGQQLHFLLDLFGELYPLDSKMSAQEERERKQWFADRRRLIDQIARKGGSLDLRNEDGLTSFGCALLKSLMSGGWTQKKPMDRLAAWHAFFDVLQRYVRLFTSHTEFNLDEQPSYFDRLFPRAINGGDLADCGVYAVRLAFVFLSLAECLKSASYPRQPRVSFIMFPLHVGLIVELDGLPPVIVHNDTLIEVAGDKLQTARKEWDSSPEPTDPTDPALLDQKFLEDVAAQLYIRDLDLPLLRLPITGLSTPPRKDEIWEAFRKLVVRRIGGLLTANVGKSASPEFEFDLRFLFVLDLEKEWHDTTVVPFWNAQCFSLWLETAGKGNPETTKQKVARNPVKRTLYALRLASLLDPVQKAYGQRYYKGRPVSETNRPLQGLCDADIEFKGDVLAKKGELTEELRAKPALLGRPAKGLPAPRITKSCRLANFASSLGPVGQVNEHLDGVRNLFSPFPTPPFATDGDKLSRHGS